MNIDSAIIQLILGGISKNSPSSSKKTKNAQSEFDALTTDKKGDQSQVDDTKQELVTQQAEEGLTVTGDAKSSFHSAMDNI